MENFAFGVVY